jgi:hypothetical protein
MLIRVLYTSVIADGLSASDVRRIIASSERRNRQLDLTGALLACEGRFAQVLEGQEALVEETLRRITADVRHHTLVIHERMPITRRLFANWDMALIDGDRYEAELQALQEGQLAPSDFLDAMAQWVDQSRWAPR